MRPRIQAAPTYRPSANATGSSTDRPNGFWRTEYGVDIQPWLVGWDEQISTYWCSSKLVQDHRNSLECVFTIEFASCPYAACFCSGPTTCIFHGGNRSPFWNSRKRKAKFNGGMRLEMKETWLLACFPSSRRPQRASHPLAGLSWQSVVMGWGGNRLNQEAIPSIRTMEQHARPQALFQYKLGRSSRRRWRGPKHDEKECFGFFLERSRKPNPTSG